ARSRILREQHSGRFRHQAQASRQMPGGKANVQCGSSCSPAADRLFMTRAVQVVSEMSINGSGGFKASSQWVVTNGGIPVGGGGREQSLSGLPLPIFLSCGFQVGNGAVEKSSAGVPAGRVDTSGRAPARGQGNWGILL